MPDNTPPFGWGPAPFDEWDLDNLLSGRRLADAPPALRQVADALIALCAAPAPAELAAEAAVMAEFSALAGFQPSGRGDASPAGVQAHTLVLPAPSPGVARKRGARHRYSRRRASRPLNWRAATLLGVAATAAIVLIIAFRGILPGPVNSPAHTSSPSAALPSASNSGSQNVAARSAVPVPSPSTSHPVPTHPATAKSPDGRTLCRTWFADFWHPQPSSRWTAERSLFGQISELAGGPGEVFGYCRPYLQDMLSHRNPWFRDGGPGSHQGGQGDTGSGDTPPSPSPPGDGNGDPASDGGPGQSH
jgi:hypothetical protein